MSGWGASLSGLDSTLGMLNDVRMRYGEDAVYIVGSNVEYAVEQEFGTSKMSAQPYLRPAAEEVKRNLPSIASNANSTEEIVRTAALEVEKRAKKKVRVDTGNLRSSITARKL